MSVPTVVIFLTLNKAGFNPENLYAAADSAKITAMKSGGFLRK
jgi:hypothetical protein